MTSATWILLAVAALLNGFLAGGNVDRSFVQMPAWRQVGARGWAAYSRHADLGNGLILYPLEAIGGALLTIAAALTYSFASAAPRSAAVPIYLSVALVSGGLLATTQAAPKMLSLRRIADELGALERAFKGFQFWGNIRAAFQILAFGANLWALVSFLTG